MSAIRARLAVFPAGRQGANYREALDATLALLSDLVDVLDTRRP